MLATFARRISALCGGQQPRSFLELPGSAYDPTASADNRRFGTGRAGRRATPITGVAEARARCLLRRVLDASQRRQYDAYGCFAVQVAGRGAFGILPRPYFNVVELRTGLLYCCVTGVAVPMADLMLAQKLLLECDPELFFATANALGEARGRDDQLRCLLAGWQGPGTATGQ
jgi:hypothetical protein